MRLNWSPLKHELALWRAEGIPLPIWWRDDDAIAATPQLAQLQAIADQCQMPLHLAIIPQPMQASVVSAVLDHHLSVPLVHGWQHKNHAPPEAKKSEFGQFRPAAPAELAQAYARLEQHFGGRLLPVFVPPWNRFDPSLTAALRTAGFAGVSTFGPRSTTIATDGVVQINTHIDPIFWRGHRGLVDPEHIIGKTVDLLRKRRCNETDRTEPLGLLTHHLVHTQDVWAFTADFLRVLLDGGAIPADLAELL